MAATARGSNGGHDAAAPPSRESGMHRERWVVVDDVSPHGDDAPRVAALAVGLAYAERPPTLAAAMLAATGADRAALARAGDHIAALQTLDEPLRAAAQLLLAEAGARASATDRGADAQRAAVTEDGRLEQAGG
jgi:hypothetical protein